MLGHAVLLLLLLLPFHPGDDDAAVSVAGLVQKNQTDFQVTALLIPILQLCKSGKGRNKSLVPKMYLVTQILSVLISTLT